MVTAAGSGYSRWRDLAVTRWREDVTRDCLGQLRLPARRAERRGLVGRLPAERRRGRQLRGRLLRGPRRDPAARRRDRDAPRDRGLAPRTTPRSAGCRSPTSARSRARSSSPPTPRSCSPRRPPTWPTRPSPSCSWRPSSPPDLERPARHAPPARTPTERRSGRRTSPAVERRAAGRDRSTRPTGRASSAAAAASRTPPRCIDGRPLSNTVGACSIRSSACAAGSACAPGATARVDLRDPGRARSREEALELADKYRDAGDLRARGDAGLDAGAGPAAPPRHRARTRRTSSSGSPTAILYSDPTLRPPAEVLRANRRGASGALGARHLRRPADRARPDRRARRPATSSASSCAPTSTGG